MLVLISGGFHPFHAGHRALYFAAKQKFSNALVLVGATDDRSQRPFPFEIKRSLARLAGVHKNDFIQVSKQFSFQDPAVLSRLWASPDTVPGILVRSNKDRSKQPQPVIRDKQGNLPLVTQGPRRGQPVSDYLTYLTGQEHRLEPMTVKAYLDYLPVQKFGPGMSSATEIRCQWPSMSLAQKKILVNGMYPVTAKNPKLTNLAVDLINRGLAVED
jgi:hypothetical protein